MRVKWPPETGGRQCAPMKLTGARDWMNCVSKKYSRVSMILKVTEIRDLAKLSRRKSSVQPMNSAPEIEVKVEKPTIREDMGSIDDLAFLGKLFTVGTHVWCIEFVFMGALLIS